MTRFDQLKARMTLNDSLAAVSTAAIDLADAINTAGEAQQTLRDAILAATEHATREQIAEALESAVEDDPERALALQGLALTDKAR